MERRYPGEPVYENRLPQDCQRPAFLLEVTKTEARDVSAALVQEHVIVRITCLTEEGDQGGGETANDRMDAVCGLLSGGLLQAGGRTLGIASVTGGGETGEPQVTAVLSYLDGRPGYEEPGAQTMEHYTLQIKADGKD